MLRSANNKLSKLILKNPLFKKDHLPKLFVVVLILIVLFYLYNHFLKEGFECSPNEVDDHIHDDDKILALFYADWCGHCKTLKPVWKEAAEEANKDKKRMIMIDVGGKTPDQQALIDKYEIDGFPTILIFQNGKPTTYSGKRDTSKTLLKLLD
jgi:protein disulfide-isomerase-like protein